MLINDTLFTLLALFLAYWFRFHAHLIPVWRGYNAADYYLLWPFATFVWILCLTAVGLYRSRSYIFNLEVWRRIITASLLALVVIIFVNFYLREAEYSRLVFGLSFLLVIVLLSASRLLLRKMVQRFLLSRPQLREKLAVLGTSLQARTVALQLAVARPFEICTVGFLSTQSAENPSSLPFPLLGNVEHLCDTLKKHQIERLVIVDHDFSSEQMEEVINECDKQMIDFYVVPDHFELLFTRARAEEVNGIPLFGLKETPLHGWNALIKRVFDLLLGSLLLIVSGPLFLLIAPLIKLDSKGPIFFRQRRMGLDGRPFIMLKFRSMHPHAEKETGPVWTTPDDARRTRVGKMLRALNLDELPQLINVVRGEMSLVGPRPERPYFVRRFREQIPSYMRRHRVRAGMTGWAQVNGLRGQTAVEERLKYDLYYIENWSLWLDIKILIKTLFARKHAY